MFPTPEAGVSGLVSGISDEGDHAFLALSRDNGERDSKEGKADITS